MIIKKIYIKSFGALIDKVIEPSAGLNIIEGRNECGKSTVSMFIKFALYGLSAKPSGSEAVSERSHYVNWDTGIASGELTFSIGEKEYRIERNLVQSLSAGREQYRESLKVIELSTGETVKTKVPGEYFLGFPEKVFMQSVFVKNIDGTRVDGTSLKVALENLMTSGSEEINTKKALEKLDSARKILKYKNGLGGRIVDLSAEKRELSALLAKSQDVSKEIVDIEGTLADLGVKIKRRENENAELAALCKAYEAVRLGKRVRDIEKCEDSVKFLSSELASVNPAADRHLLAKIDICRSSIEETQRDTAVLKAKRAVLEEKCGGETPEEPKAADELLCEAKSLKKSRALFAFLGAVSAVAAAALASVGVIFGLLAENDIISISCFAAGGVLLVAFVFMLAFAAGKSSKLKALFAKWGALSIEEFETRVFENSEKYEYSKRLFDKMAQIDMVIEEAQARHSRECERAFEIGKIMNIEANDDPDKTLEEAKEAVLAVCEKRDAMNARLENEKGKLSALLEEIGDAERLCAAEKEKEALESMDREKILSMTKEQYAENIRLRNFGESQTAALRQRERELEKRLAALRAAGESPSEIAGRISCLEAEISSLNFKYASLVTAYNALERAGEKMRGDVVPKIAEKASEMMGYVTAGKYDELSSGDDLTLSFDCAGEKKTVDFLSEGTKDAAYISMRTALAQIMYDGEPPAMIFDECFARMDEERLRGILEMLSRDSAPQCLVFTCRSLEAKVAKNSNVITL